ncbi:methanethiol S-methyltransferase [Pseudanabaena sp. PCC 6802]|uniref:methanethiol S-methyltransferase n=1 Tax=Pseudanabaena sp. PCC 6802 TaxID=118173 RepID=UPI0003473684|nr:methanethiol S-methyltransferase [Pseudanabaena sp. PCC 6802]
MVRIIAFIYGVVAYSIFLVTFVYAIGFVGNLGVPKSMDSGAEGSIVQALLINAILLGIFAIQHSLMARPAFKKVWTQVVPEPTERSTYVLASSLALFLVFWQWQPMGGIIWEVDNPWGRLFLEAICGMGWLIVLGSTFLINHFDLFGLRQVYRYLRGRAYTPIQFNTPGLYQYVRHPLYLGWLLAFWATPKMTVAHLVFAVLTTAYILIAIRFEERDLIDVHGEAYENYRMCVPAIVPLLKKKVPLPKE